MVAGRFKSRTFRRVFVKTPGGKTKVHYRRRKLGRAICAVCKKPLHGVPRKIQSEFKNLPKTKKRPSRPYSNLCSSCMSEKIL